MISAPYPEPNPAAKRYELLTLGDELLLGLVPNGHLTFVGTQLARRGVMLQRNVSVSDDANVIARQFAESWRSADVVITTGGLGPTCDDRTREAIAQVLGQNLVHDDAVEATIRARFVKFGRTMTPNNLKQALRPERAEVLPNVNGTAPGLWVEQDGKILCMLPGPPNELHPMFVEQVLPRLTRLGMLAKEEVYVQLRTIGVGESLLETTLQPVFEKITAVAGANALNVAYCAHLGAVDCRVSSPDGTLSHAQLGEVARECQEMLGDDVYCIGHSTLPKVAANLLLGSKKILATAEVSTGGMLANRFSEIAHAERFFAGGVVCPTNESKMQILDVPEEILLQHGDASEECAMAMATGAAEQLGADYALALTDFKKETAAHGHGVLAGVGAICVGLYSPKGIRARTITYPGSHEAVRERALTAALDWLRRDLLDTKKETIVFASSGDSAHHAL